MSLTQNASAPPPRTDGDGSITATSPLLQEQNPHPPFAYAHTQPIQSSSAINRQLPQRRGGGYAALPGTDEDDEDLSDIIEDDFPGSSPLHTPTGTILSSTINLANTILGAGMLAMPSAIAAVGLGLGIFMVGLSASASAFGLYLLSQCAACVEDRKSSFFNCSKITYPAAAVWFDLAIAVKCFGVSISYLIIVGDLIPKVVAAVDPDLPLDSLLRTKGFWVTVAVLFIAPFCFAKRLDSLRYTSAVALVAVLYLVVIVLSYGFFPPGPDTGMPPRPTWDDIRWINVDLKFFTTLPIFVFAFTCHQNIFSIYNELVDNSPRRIGYVIYLSVGVAFVIYQLLAVVGYLTFGNSVGSNIIALYPPSPVITGGQVAIALLVLLSYPLQCHPCRASLEKVISRGQPTTMTAFKWIFMTLGILSSSYAIAVSVKNLSTVLALVGATGSTTICYILPGLLYHRMREIEDEQQASHEQDDGKSAKKWDVTRVLAVALTIFGLFVMVLSVSMQVVRIFYGGQSEGEAGH